MIGPIVKLLFTDGTKKRLELYNRPPAIVLEGTDAEGNKVETTFIRSGPDEYRQKVVKEQAKKAEKKFEKKIIKVGG